MTKINPNKLIYLISPPHITINTFIPALQNALRAHQYISMFQLRLKGVDDGFIMDAAYQLMPLLKACNIPFIINDNPYIAKEVRADGVHLGDEDLSLDVARRVLDRDAIIGVSCYDDIEMAKNKARLGVDYISFGAFHKSKTKQSKGNPSYSILPAFTEWQKKKNINIPVVAIGGINNINSAQLLHEGANMLAVISYIWEDNRDNEKQACINLVT